LGVQVTTIQLQETDSILETVGVSTVADITKLFHPLASVADGQGSHAEGSEAFALGDYSHAEGGSYFKDFTTALGNFSHAEGIGTVSLGPGSHAEGFIAKAEGYSSHAEGSATIATGEYSHAEGFSSYAIGTASHAEGRNTYTFGDHSHTAGHRTRTSDSYQFVVGQLNVTRSGEAAFIIGDGYIVDGFPDVRHNLLFASQSWFEVSASNVFFQGLPEQSQDYALVYNNTTGKVTYSDYINVDGAWAAYTPSWTSDGTQPVLNNGTLTGKYKQIGKTVFVRVKLLIGTTTTTGTGTWYFSLPVTASASDAIIMPATLLDNTVSWYQATVNGVYGNFTYKTALIHDTAGSGSVSVTSTTPFTWDSPDSLQFNGSYEAESAAP
jgi:hypothetical protein